ncbi:hypothetical protein [[Eubacterium] hominis]|uniref:hypothetical protein n=1 Tax=[Eubacterium] hominis TaxID=2764325 RepID=UPI003A4DE326
MVIMNYITITGANHQFGMEVFLVGQILYLEKDEYNEFDDEVIRVMSDANVIYGYVANSVYTVARGTKSAGCIYDTFEHVQKIEVNFINGNSVIAEFEEDRKIKVI